MTIEIERNVTFPQANRDHTPVITNSCKVVVAGFLENDGRVLLARRAITKAIAPGLLHLPGGHVEPGESLESALVREFQEEFHLDIQLGKLVHTFEYKTGEVNTKGYVFFVRASSIPPDLHFDLIDNSEVLWSLPTDLDHLFSDSGDHNYVAADKAFVELSCADKPAKP